MLLIYRGYIIYALAEVQVIELRVNNPYNAVCFGRV